MSTAGHAGFDFSFVVFHLPAMVSPREEFGFGLWGVWEWRWHDGGYDGGCRLWFGTGLSLLY